MESMSCHNLITWRAIKAFESVGDMPPEDELTASILELLEVDSLASGADQLVEEEEDKDILTSRLRGMIRDMEQENED